jgi:hypothetical protein
MYGLRWSLSASSLRSQKDEDFLTVSLERQLDSEASVLLEDYQRRAERRSAFEQSEGLANCDHLRGATKMKSHLLQQKAKSLTLSAAAIAVS